MCWGFCLSSTLHHPAYTWPEHQGRKGWRQKASDSLTLFLCSFLFSFVQIFLYCQIWSKWVTVLYLHLWWSSYTMFHEKGKTGDSGFPRIPGDSLFMWRCQPAYWWMGSITERKPCYQTASWIRTTLYKPTTPFYSDSVYFPRHVECHLWGGNSSVPGSMRNIWATTFVGVGFVSCHCQGMLPVNIS